MSAQETIDQQPSTPELSLRTYLERTKHGKRKNNGLVIDPSIVVEVPGFNTRVAGMGELYYSLPDVAAHIDSLAHAYLTDALNVPAIVVQMVGGVPVLRQGACRTRGIAKANRILAAEGQERITEIKVEEFRGTNVEAEAITFTGNKVLPLSDIAVATSMRNMLQDEDAPVKLADLAKMHGKSEQHIRKLISLLDLPLNIQELIIRKQVSMYAALDEYMLSGEKAFENIIKANEIYGKATDKTLRLMKVGDLQQKHDTKAGGQPENKDNDVKDLPGNDDAGAVIDAENHANSGADADPKENGGEVYTDLNQSNNAGNGQNDDNADVTPPPANKGNQKPVAPAYSEVVSKKLMTTATDLAVPFFKRLIEDSKIKDGETRSKTTHTLTLTDDEMMAIANYMDSLSDFLEKHAAKQARQKK